MPAESWHAPLAEFAAKAGFAEAAIDSMAGAPQLPTSARLWRASYARLLVLPVAEPAEVALRAAVTMGQEWLDVACMDDERADHRVMDAYLLLLSGIPIPDALFAVVQDIELDPTACRKHVAWPIAGAGDDIVWRRLLRVTALGLPASPAASGMTNTPVLRSAFQRSLLKDVKDLNGKPAARQHAENPLPDETQ